MTIIEAVRTVLQKSKAGMTSKEIYQAIVEQNLYVFPAKNPAAVVNSIIRRHCAGLNFPTASLVKYFTIEKCVGKKTYYILLSETVAEKSMSAVVLKQNQALDMLPEERIQVAYDEYMKEIKSQLLDTIMSNSPSFLNT